MGFFPFELFLLPKGLYLERILKYLALLLLLLAQAGNTLRAHGEAKAISHISSLEDISVDLHVFILLVFLGAGL